MSPSTLSVHTLLSPIYLCTPLASLALPSCCILYFCRAICPHTTFQSGICHFLLLFIFFSVYWQLHVHSLHSAPPWCPLLLPTHTYVSPPSRSRLTLSIDHTWIQRCHCRGKSRLLEKPVALQLELHGAQDCLETKASFKGSQRLAAYSNHHEAAMALQLKQLRCICLLYNAAV